MASRPSSEQGPASPSGVRVVVVSHGPPMRGGIATVALDIVEDAALNQEFEMVFLNTSQNDSARGEFGVRNILRALQHALDTFRLARRGSVVHTHSVQHPVFVAWRQVAIAVAARLRGARVMLHNHGFLPYMADAGGYRVGAAHRLAFTLLDRLCSANVLIGETGVANMRPNMPTIDLPVVHNSVVVNEVTPSSGVHDPAVILFVGELLERKGLSVLLDALDLLDSRGEHAYELRIVGDDTPGLDPDKDAMVARIRARGRGEAMTGPVPRSEVYRHMSEADVFVLPTRYEGQPFTIIESLAAGLPIVATDIPAIRSMVTHGDNALLVPWNDAEALADALASLLDDPGERRRMSLANRDLAAQRFDRSVFRTQLAELYRLYGVPTRKVLGRQRARACSEQGPAAPDRLRADPDASG